MAEQMAISEIALQLDAKRVQQERPRAVQEDNKVCSLLYLSCSTHFPNQ